MKSKYTYFICLKLHSFRAVYMVAVILMFGTLSSSAQTGDYLYSGSEQSIVLGPGLYDITAYGAQGGSGFPGNTETGIGGLGAEMSGEFSFSGLTTLTLLVGGVGGQGFEAIGGGYGGGGGGGSFVVSGSTPLVVAGGGGGGTTTSFGDGGPGLITTSGGGGNPGYGGAAGISGSGGSGGGGDGGVGGGGGGGGYSGDGSSGSGGFESRVNGGGGLSFEAGGGEGLGNGSYGGYGGGGASGLDDPGVAPYGSAGGGGGYSGGGGGGNGGAGGGGGSIIDTSAIGILTEVSGIASPDDSQGNGEIIITAVPEPGTLALAGLGGLSLLLFRRQRR